MPQQAANFYELFAQTVARFGARTAVEVQRRDSVESHTYADLAALAERVAAFLLARGVAPGDRCAILADNDARWVAAYLGIFRIGGVAVPLDTAYKARQIAALARDSGAKIFFTSPKFLASVREGLCAAGSDARPLLLFGAADGLESLDALAAEKAASPLPPCPARPEDPAVMLYTSGTTSDPKGVVLTHANLIAESESVFATIFVDERDSLLGVLPLFHALAQMASLLLPFLVGARVVYLETLNTSELLRALRERGISIFVCVPQFFYLIHERVRKQVSSASLLKRLLFGLLLRLNHALRRTLRLNLGRQLFRPVHAVLGEKMRLLVTGGSRFDPRVGADLYSMGFNIIQAYGLTECSGAATIVREGDEKLGSVGQALPGVELKIVPPADSAGEEQRGPGGEPVGEVCIRGGIVMQGYYHRPDANADTLRDSWLHTGDLGYLDSDGRLYIAGRLKEIIVTSSGKNIYPEEIEAHYQQSPFIKEICVMGRARPGEPAAERLHAVVVPDFDVMRERKVLNAREILRFEIESLSVQLPAAKRVLSYDIWNEDLPRTTTRKLKRFQIAARVEALEMSRARETEAPAASGQDAAWAADPRVEQALAIIREAAKVKTALRPDANIELELGLDSMERVELLTHLEETFGTEVPDEVAHRIYTVRELVDAVTAGATRSAADASRDAWGRLLREAPEDDPVLRELLKPKPVAAALGFALLKLTYWMWWLVPGLRVCGRARLPERGPFLLCPNHQSYLDAFLLVASLPYRVMRQMFFVGASEYFASPLMQWVAKKINCVPVDPDTNLVRAMQAGAFGLKHGKVLILFPEGERSIDGLPKKFKKGAPILSMHLGAPIVPVALEGAYDLWPRERGIRWSAMFRRNARAPLRLSFGTPLPPPEPLPEDTTFSAAESAYSRAADELRARVLALAPSLRAAESGHA